MTRRLQGDEARTAWGSLGEAVLAAEQSKCLRSKCGAVIMADGLVIGRGWNSPPGDCEIAACRKDDLPAGFKSDRTCCLHAEQRAIMDALRHHPDSVPGATLWFVRLDTELAPKVSGRPYCSICSKMALDAGLADFVLWHLDGFTAYDTADYNEITFAYDGD